DSIVVSDQARPESPAAGEDVSIDAAPRAAARLFILPAIVTGVIASILAVYFLFGALTRDTRSAESYLVEVRSGQGNRRWQAAYALGLLADPASCGPLREALHDREIDVTWNSAVALARIGDPTGAEVLRSMADREFVERASQTQDPAARSVVLITAVQALVLI